MGAVHGTVSAQVPFLMFHQADNGVEPTAKNDSNVKQSAPRMIRSSFAFPFFVTIFVNVKLANNFCNERFAFFQFKLKCSHSRPFVRFEKKSKKILEISNNGRGNIRHCSSQYSNQVDFNGRGQSLRDPAARRVLSSSIRFCRINKTKNIPRFYEETSATRRIAPLPTPSICYFDVGRVIRKCNKMEINRNYLSIANVVPFLNYYFYQYFLLNFAIHHFTLRVGK